MSSLADAPDLVGFFSYSREDDEDSGGKLSKLRERIQAELRGQLGRTKRDFRLWQDKDAIAHGELWEDRIRTAIFESVFFIPIITPTAVRSYHCKFEFDSFLAREKELGRSNLVFPILYISVPALTGDRWRQDPLLAIIGSRQYEQWQNLRHLDASSTEVALRVEKFCANICRALQQEWLSPEERQQAEARRVAEDERRRQEAEITQRADEEERRRKAEAEERRRDDDERRRQEAEVKRRLSEAKAEKRRQDEERRGQARAQGGDRALQAQIAREAETQPGIKWGRYKALWLIAGLAVSIAGLAAGGITYYQPSHQTTREPASAQQLEEAAAKGDATAMVKLGVLYANGEGVARDYAKAREWWEKAAAKGDAKAMANLGLLYSNSDGVAQDYAKARELYEKAADKGDENAMFRLGGLYAEGHGVAQDYAKARGWWEKAADTGDENAMFTLGELYRNGHGVAQDYAKAREWYEKAADKGDERAKAKLEQLSISEAFEAGRYGEALRRQEALVVKVEAAETEREGKPGEETARALNDVAWYALFAREYTKALTVADRAHALLPDDLGIETNRAHALMFLERGEDSKAIYLAYKGKPMSKQDARLWERVIADDFAELRRAGLTHPMMADIEKELGVSPDHR
jgi:TPR repeat protein